MKHKGILAALPVIALLCGCTMAQDGAISRAYSSMNKGRYDKALARLSEAESYAEMPPERHAEVLFLRAQSLEGLQQPAQALGIYRYIADRFPDTSHGYRAKERLRESGQ